MTMIETMIYVHIPFCDSKCLYCNFVSGIYSEEIKQQYFLKLNKEIEYNANKKYIVTSIYIGGGTPSSIDSKYVVELINIIFTSFTIKDDVEITIEANPCSLNREKLHDYKNCKINRLSIGVQSLDNYCLKKIRLLLLIFKERMVSNYDESNKNGVNLCFCGGCFGSYSFLCEFC